MTPVTAGAAADLAEGAAGAAAGAAAAAAAANGPADGIRQSSSASCVIADRTIELNPLDWAYRGEGSANIVMSYCGHVPALKGMVLRVCKERPDSHHPGAEVVAGESLTGGSAGASEAGSAGVPEAGSVQPEPVLRPEERELWGEVVPELARAPDRIDLLHQYVSRVMAPLIGEEFVEAGIAVNVPRSFLQEVADHIRPSRPPWRQAQGDVDLSIGEALLVTDLTHLHLEDEEWEEEEKGEGKEEGGEEGRSQEQREQEVRREEGHGSCCGYNGTTFCIELKPKTGFCPSSPFIAPANHVKTSVPRFLMHQQLKLAEGEVAESSTYNPLDLFSSSPPRVLTALRSLLEHPQNNLRIFADGRLLLGGHIHRHGDGGKGKKKGEKGAKEEKGENGEKGEKGKKGEEGEKGEKVGNGKVGVGLAALRMKEKALEAAGLAAVEAALEGFVCVGEEPSNAAAAAAGSTDAAGSSSPHHSSAAPHLVHPRVDALLALATECLVQSGAMEKLLAAQKLDTWDVEGTIHAYNQFIKETGEATAAAAAAAAAASDDRGSLSEITKDCRKVLRDFLIAATAKDCGIMLALRAAIPGETLEASQKLRSIVCPSSGCKYFYRLSIMDLDIKPLRKMPKYWSMDQQIVRNYSSATASGNSHEGTANGVL
ncbi:hypothetical protein CLOP_g14672 [Closterium sp. NIES-67]|nr:hypothetical protein CLOP_g14672 [Closterium sp. NIES-67]